MSIASMCRGTFIRRNKKVIATGVAGGDASTDSLDSSTMECGAQESGANFDTRSDAQANQAVWRFYFPSSPGLTIRDELIVSKHRGVAYSTARSFRVNATKFQGSPSGGLQLWIADAEEF